MLDDYIIEQPVACKILVNALKKDKLSHAYLFEINNYKSGFDIALSFAKSLLCKNKFTNNSNCKNCTICSTIDSRNYSELKIIESDGIWIKKEQLDNLQKDFSKKSINGGKQVYIINHAEKLNPQASNSILKFLEEPSPNIIAILITNNKYNLLDTIISRCQLISLNDKTELISNMSITEKIANSLFNNQQEISDFMSNQHNQEIIDITMAFIIFLEKNGLNTLLFSNKYWHSVIKDKNEAMIAFSIMLLYYKDILNVKLNKEPIIYNLDSNFDSIENNNAEKEICDKIDVILKQKQKIQSNVNTNLLIDKFIIEMENCNGRSCWNNI